MAHATVLHYVKLFIAKESHCIANYMYTYFYRKNGFVYQYVNSFKQDLEGLLTMTQNNDQVIGGLCQDFFEFYEVLHIIKV